jgi:DNA sulfur modification protein DndC
VVRSLELITREELDEIRRMWVFDKHEIEDSLPRIYEDVTGEVYPGPRHLNDNHVFGAQEMKLLREVCDGDDLHFQLLRELLDVEGSYRTMTRRAGIFDALEKAFKRSAFDDVEEATQLARQKRDILDAARGGELERLDQLLHDVEDLEHNDMLPPMDTATLAKEAHP